LTWSFRGDEQANSD